MFVPLKKIYVINFRNSCCSAENKGCYCESWLITEVSYRAPGARQYSQGQSPRHVASHAFSPGVFNPCWAVWLGVTCQGCVYLQRWMESDVRCVSCVGSYSFLSVKFRGTRGCGRHTRWSRNQPSLAFWRKLLFLESHCTCVSATSKFWMSIQVLHDKCDYDVLLRTWTLNFSF